MVLPVACANSMAMHGSGFKHSLMSYINMVFLNPSYWFETNSKLWQQKQPDTTATWQNRHETCLLRMFSFDLLWCPALAPSSVILAQKKQDAIKKKKIIYDHWRTGVDLLKRVLLQYHGWDGAFNILMDVQEYFRTSSSKCSWNPMLGYLFAGVRKCPNWTSPNYWEYKFQQIFEGDVQNPQEGTFTDPVLFSVLSLKNNLPMGNSSGNWC